MSYEFYKVLHLTGLMLLFFGFGATLILSYAGVPFQGKSKMLAFVTHGVGLLFLIVSGFGLLARLGLVQQLPGWVHAKITIWVLMGLAISLARRKGKFGLPVTILLIGIGMTAAIIAINKPF